MAAFPSTTVTALEAALRLRIDGIVPTHQIEQSSAWHYAEDREMPAPSEVPRMYSFNWGDPEVVLGGATGNADTEVRLTLDIVTDYRAFREADIGWVIESDHWDLHDRLMDSWSQDIVSGMTFSDSQGFETEDAQRVTHSFVIQYMRARRS